MREERAERVQPRDDARSRQARRDDARPRDRGAPVPAQLDVENVAGALSDVPYAVVAAEAASSKAPDPPVVIDVADLLVITDYFVVTSGTNDRQVRAIVEEVERRVRSEGGGSPLRVEGRGDARWVLMDYGDYVVHVFDAEARAFYDIERLWADAPRLEWGDGDGRRRSYRRLVSSSGSCSPPG